VTLIFTKPDAAYAMVSWASRTDFASLPDLSGSAEDLMRAVDRAMCLVKNSGKKGIHVAEGNA